MNRYAERTLKHLMEQLGSADQKLIDRQIDELIEKNTQLTGNSEGFLLGGMFFTRLDNVAKLAAKKRPLHTSSPCASCLGFLERADMSAVR